MRDVDATVELSDLELEGVGGGKAMPQGRFPMRPIWFGGGGFGGGGGGGFGGGGATAAAGGGCPGGNC